MDECHSLHELTKSRTKQSLSYELSSRQQMGGNYKLTPREQTLVYGKTFEQKCQTNKFW